MPTLVDQLANDAIRPKVVNDCIELVDAQVKQKGFVIKSAYAMVKGIKKTFVPEVINTLLPDWLAKLQPHYDKWAAAKTTSFSEYVISRSDEVAESLLSVTDARADRTSHTTAKKMYQRMRPGAKKDVIEAIPELSKMIERHLKAQQAA